ncbi:hypothetical protein WA026_016535 [Henosepilachna vigintioctopunctata]|uniref:SAC3/GANP/THP3 conserved domain-containing protein n=1 Tax=Henosepilachna vigintioctopunctata TaxID=420089 RepID=A0AAW1VGD4_9CUCU
MKRVPEKLNKPKADPNRVVKEFNRSAAGKSMTNENNLRPPEVLLQTLHYLLHDVINDTQVSWIVKYNFITDRLRSIRQDMVIQNTSKAYSICLLQPIVRFHAYSAYKLCDQEISAFDPHLNNKHLQECLKRLLVIYDEIEEMLKWNSRDFNDLEFLKESRPFFEALYVVLNLGNEVALHRVLKLSHTWRTPLVKKSILISLNYLRCNYLRACRYIKHLPPILLAISALHLTEIRSKALEMMSVAYNSKILTFPLTSLKYLLLYDTEEDVIQDCRSFGLELMNDSVRFNKNSFKKQTVKIMKKKTQFVERVLESMDESDMLLFS